MKQFKLIERSKYHGDNIHGVYNTKEEAEDDKSHFDDRYSIDCEIVEEKCNMGTLELYSEDVNFSKHSWQEICDVVGVDSSLTDKISLKFDKDSIKTNTIRKGDNLTVLKSADV